MNLLLVAAAVLTVLVAATHSLLGEKMIFGGAAELPSTFRGILRATWHATSLLGLALAAVMLSHGLAGEPPPNAVRLSTAAAMGLSALAVLVWTGGRHPGWIALGLVGALCALA